MIHEIKEIKTFIISSQDVWLPGSYNSKKTANYAFRFTDEELSSLQESINPGGIITYEMLKKIKNDRL